MRDMEKNTVTCLHVLQSPTCSVLFQDNQNLQFEFIWAHCHIWHFKGHSHAYLVRKYCYAAHDCAKCVAYVHEDY